MASPARRSWSPARWSTGSTRSEIEELFQSGLHEFVSDAIDTTRQPVARDQQGVSLLGVLMRLTVRHATTYSYEPPAERCALRLRLYPPAFDSQRVK
jgi:hypothetical protein